MAKIPEELGYCCDGCGIMRYIDSNHWFLGRVAGCLDPKRGVLEIITWNDAQDDEKRIWNCFCGIKCLTVWVNSMAEKKITSREFTACTEAS